MHCLECGAKMDARVAWCDSANTGKLSRNERIVVWVCQQCTPRSYAETSPYRGETA